MAYPTVIRSVLEGVIDMINNDKSFLRNKGRISYTYKDSGDYGEFLNACRLDAWETAVGKYEVKRDSVFDIGCSYGSWHSNYKDSLGFGKLFGLDPNEEAVSVVSEILCLSRFNKLIV